MPFFQWIEDYSVGVKEMDEQHKQLMVFIDQLYKAMRADAGKETMDGIISPLISCMLTHFATEEQLMQQYGYPGYQDHHRVHGDIALKIKTINASHKTLADAVNPELMAFLRTLLINHLHQEDQAYGRYIVSRMHLGQ